MFNFGAGELTVMALLAILFFGPERLPSVQRALSRFSRSDWLRVSAALLAVTVALALLSGARY